MQIVENQSQQIIKAGAKALKSGNLVAFPTETVYGLGADALNEKAVARIFSIKSRPTFHPLIVHISTILKITSWAIEIQDYVFDLARDFWPGPMTLILKRSNLAGNFITGNQETVGLRVPSHPVALNLLNEFESLGGLGIAAPSANKFGAVSPTNSQDVVEEIGSSLDKNDLIIDAGQCLIGVESTIIDCTKQKPQILRPGSVTQELISTSLGFNVNFAVKTNIKAPGILDSHYSPKAKVVISSRANAGEGFIALAEVPTPKGAIRLTSPKTIQDYAGELYIAVRKADHLGLDKISVVPPEGAGLAMAVRDRISKMIQKNFG